MGLGEPQVINTRANLPLHREPGSNYSPISLPGTDASPGVRGRTGVGAWSQGSDSSRDRASVRSQGGGRRLQGTARPACEVAVQAGQGRAHISWGFDYSWVTGRGWPQRVRRPGSRW